MRIGEVAEQTSLSFRTLRHYDDIGLVSPSARTEGGFRLYTETDVARLMVIRRMKPLGYTLDEMSELLDIVDALRVHPSDPKLRDRLSDAMDEARERRAKLATHLDMADEFIGQLKGI
ncbi:MerR family transcriptional regulator [Microbacterium sp.]|uniref:MerR family transcriptional regulator n=1 Tax=Microbacterium sp. TaxID=51671 RepID=UPI003564E7CF